MSTRDSTGTKINHVVQETITFATGNLTRAVNAPRGAGGFELYGTGGSTPLWQMAPLLMNCQFFDNSAGTYTSGTENLTSRLTANVLTLSAMEATVDFVYFGCDTMFRGVYLNVGSANAVASVLAATYWDGAAWTGLTETDGTASGGATLAIDNSLTWTLPTDWAKTSVNGSNSLFFVRFNVTGTLTTPTTLIEAIPLSVQTGRAISPAAAAVLPRYWFDRGGVGGLEAVADNTDTLVITWLGTSPYITATAE